MTVLRASALIVILVLSLPATIFAIEIRNDLGKKTVSRLARAGYQDAGDDQTAGSPSPRTTPNVEQDATVGSGVAPDEIVVEGDTMGLFADELSGPFAGEACGDGCATCGPHRFPNYAGHGGGGWWLGAEYLLWWREGSELPPLVTTAPSGTNPALGNPGTTILFGNEKVGEHARAGARLSFGHWFDPCQSFGLEGRYVWMGDAHTRFFADSSNFPVLGLPFFDAATGSQEAFVVARDTGDPTRSGSVLVSTSNDVNVWDLVFRKRFWGCGPNRIDLLVGYQASRIDDNLQVSSVSTVTGGSEPLGSETQRLDDFATTNEFHGVVLGLSSYCCRGPYSVKLRGSIAFGSVDQIIAIRGQSSSFVPPSSTSTSNEGLFAQSTNIGTYSAEEFIVLPEFGAQFVWDISCCLQMNVGYSLLYWSDIAQAGDQVDTVLNLNDPGTFNGDTARPVFRLNSNSYFVHGFSAGLTYRF